MLKVYWVTLSFFLVILPGFATHSVEEVDSLHELTYPLLLADGDTAINIANQALEIAKEINYDFGVANSYYILGYIYQQKNNDLHGVYLYLKASNVLRNKKDKRSVWNHTEILQHIGRALVDFGKYDEALQFVEDGLSIIYANKRELFGKREMDLLYQKSKIFREKGKNDEALEILAEIIPKTKESGYEIGYFNSLNLAGIIQHYKEDYTEARRYYQMIIDNHPSYHFVGVALQNIAETYFESNEFELAEEYYLRALDSMRLEKKVSIERYQFNVFEDLTKLYLTSGQYDKCIEMGKIAVSYYKYTTRYPKKFLIFEHLSKAYHEIGLPDSSHYYANRYYSENEVYQKRQEELMKIRDEFKIDVFLEEYYSQQDDYPVSFYMTSIGVLLLGFLVLILYQLKVKILSK